MKPIEQSEAVIRRFYGELWNCWRLEVADGIRAAFPDRHNQIDEILAVDDRVVTRMTWTGNHRDALGDIEPTDAHVEHAGAALFRLKEGLIEEAWVVGDTQELWRALGVLVSDI